MIAKRSLSNKFCPIKIMMKVKYVSRSLNIKLLIPLKEPLDPLPLKGNGPENIIWILLMLLVNL